jgi:hypothetical protein
MVKRLAAAALMGLSIFAVAVQAQDKKKNKDEDKGCPITFPAASENDYRPTKPDFDDLAKKDTPPPWFVAAEAILLWGLRNDVGASAKCAAWTIWGRTQGLRKQRLSEAWAAIHHVWDEDKKASIAIVAPRNVTGDEVKTATLPAWTKDLGGTIDWRPTNSSAFRRDQLEVAAMREVMNNWNKAHKDAFAKVKAGLIEKAETVTIEDYVNSLKNQVAGTEASGKYAGKAIKMHVHLWGGPKDWGPRHGPTVGDMLVPIKISPAKDKKPGYLTGTGTSGSTFLVAVPKADYDAQKAFWQAAASGDETGSVADIVVLVTTELANLYSLNGGFEGFGVCHGYILDAKVTDK